MDDFRMRIRMRACGVTHATAMSGHDAGDLRPTHVSAHGLRCRDPVIARSAFHGLKALIQQHAYRVAMVGLDRPAFSLVVRVVHPWFRLADTNEICPQKMA